MNTQVATFTALSALLKITDLLAPSANTPVIHNVMPNAMKSGGRPNIVPTAPAMLRPISPPDKESKLALKAQAHALVPNLKEKL